VIALLTLIQPAGHVDAGPVSVGSDAQPPSWSTAEEEKQRLYEQAQAAVRRTQGISYSPPPETSAQAISVGAALYSDAMLSMRREPQNTQPHASPERDDAIPQYPSPQSEKEMLKRYYDAKAVASRNQGQDYAQAEPISYDALYPSNNPNSGMTSQPSNLDRPPSFPTGPDDPPAFTSGSQHPILSEKERLRRHYEAQDAVSNSVASPPPTSIPTPVYMPSPQLSQAVSPYPQHIPTTPPETNSPPPPINSPPAPMNALAEKEMLRKRYETEDAARQVQNRSGRTPSRSGSALPPIPRSPTSQANSTGRPLTATEEKAQLASRYASNPPASPPSPGRPLTAAEEKAQLKAQYEARDQVVSPPVQPQQIQTPASAFNNVNQNNTLPTPPPLKPRPPVDYINQTKEEDARALTKYLDRQRVESLGSLRGQGKPDLSRQPPLNGPTTNGNGNGNAYSHES
jgi:hypothetical protein